MNTKSLCFAASRLRVKIRRWEGSREAAKGAKKQVNQLNLGGLPDDKRRDESLNIPSFNLFQKLLAASSIDGVARQEINECILA
jgi:hypothetical protein